MEISSTVVLYYDHLDAIEYSDLSNSTARASESALTPGPTSLAPCNVFGVIGVVEVEIDLLLCTTLLLVAFLIFLCCPSKTGDPSSCNLWPNGILAVDDGKKVGFNVEET